VSDLPKGWAKTTLGSLALYVNGKGFKKREWKTDGLPIIRIQNLNKPTAKFNYADNSHEDKFRVKSGDLLVAWSASLGAFIWERGNAWLNQHIFRVDPFYEVVDKQFLYYVVKNSIEDLYGKTHGMGMVHVTKGKFEGHEIHLPPLNEQLRIANKLDSILAKVDKAQARLEKIPTILKRFRQSVLTAAVSGELTREWRVENESSEWLSVKLIDVVQAKPRNGNSPKGVDYQTDVKNLTLSAVTKGYFVENKYKYVDLNVPKDSYLWIKNGDLLIQRANSLEYVGVSALYEGEDDLYIYPDLIMKCRANEKVETKYLYYSLLSEKVRQYFRDNATGTSGNMPKINQGVVSSAPINLPGLEEQKEIVRRVESMFYLADGVEKKYTEVKQRTDRLTQSLLAKVFRGELVPQDPNDEPADQLLKRIAEAKSKFIKAKRPLKNKSVINKVPKAVKVEAVLDVGSDLKVSSTIKTMQKSGSAEEEIFETLSEIYNGDEVELEVLLSALNRPYEDTQKALFNLIKGDLNISLKSKAKLSWDGVYKIKAIS
jgi:type I restriction enzyme S subunit